MRTDLEAAAGVLTVLAALVSPSLHELRDQALDGAADFRAAMDGFTEHAAVPAQDKAAIRPLDFGE